MRRCSWDVNFNVPSFGSASPVKLFVHREWPLLVLATKYSTYIKTYDWSRTSWDPSKMTEEGTCCVNSDDWSLMYRRLYLLQHNRLNVEGTEISSGLATTDIDNEQPAGRGSRAVGVRDGWYAGPSSGLHEKGRSARTAPTDQRRQTLHEFPRNPLRQGSDWQTSFPGSFDYTYTVQSYEVMCSVSFLDCFKCN